MITLGSDALITLTGLYDNISAQYANSATVTGSLNDSDDVVKSTFTLDYVAASDGNYVGVILAAVTTGLDENARYGVVITAISGAATYKETLYVNTVEMNP
jgi:hypothetical protein